MSGAWSTFWGALLGVTLVAYVGLVVFVSIGGFQDIRAMFERLKSEERDEDPPSEQPRGSADD